MLDGRQKASELPPTLDRKTRTEKSGPYWFSSAPDPAQNDRCIVYPPVGEKRLGRYGSLEASELMLARKSANRKYESHGLPEDEQMVGSDARS